MMSARAGQFLLRSPQPSGQGASLPRRFLAAFHDPFASNYPPAPDNLRDSRSQNGVPAGEPAGGSLGSHSYGQGSHFEAPIGSITNNTYDPSQASGPYGHFGVTDSSGVPYYPPGVPGQAGGISENTYGAVPYAYQPPAAPFSPYHGGSPYAPPPVGGVGHYPPPPMGGPYGMAPPYPQPPQQGQGPWGPGHSQGGPWTSQGPGGGRANIPGNEGGAPSLTARERQRQFLSAALLGELDALEGKRSVSLYMQGLNGGRLAGRMGPKEWLYTTNVLSELLRKEEQEEPDFGLLLQQQLLLLQQLRQLLRGGRSHFLPHDVALLAANAARMQALFSMRFLTRDAAQKAKDVLANPAPFLRQALQSVAGNDAAGAATAEGPVSISAYRGVCDDLVSEFVFCCAKKVEGYPASTQPSHVRALPTLMRAAPAQLLPKEPQQQQQQMQYTGKTVKAVWTELLLRLCPLLGRYEVVQLLQILHGASALANRKVIRDNDLLTLTQAAGALLEQERFVAEVPEAHRSRILQEFFKWSLETNAPFAFVRHVAWKATRLFKLNVRWLSSNETARLLPLICANRVLLSEDELTFFVQVLLKRVSRATPLYAEAQKLSADAAAAALFGVAINGAEPQRFAGLISHLLQEAPALEDLPRAQSVVFARLCWALCAIRAFDPAIAGDCWRVTDVAALLQSALRRVEPDNAASLALIPEILTEVELSKDLLPQFEVPAAIQSAATEASRIQVALDRRQSRRLHFTIRRALEKLGAQVQPADFSDAEGNQTAKDQGDVHEKEGSFTNQAETAEVGDGAQETPATLGPSERWVYNAQLGPYNVSFYCPARKLVLEIDDRWLGPSKYMKKRHLEKLFQEDGLRVLVAGEHLFQLSRITGEQGIDLLRSAITSAAGAEDVCPSRHVQLQALLKRFARQKPRTDDGTAATANGP